jgi:hypothetical protein
MKIRHLQLPSGINEGIPLLVDAHWTSEQALAVVALLDDLREQIVRHYMLQIQAYYQDDRMPDGSPRDADPGIDSEPF